ncbi:MAG: 2-hydroxyacyl-CoA dehydratase [Candidatus Lokiarchaeota archaeon]|nr:2-hydroxyacyl-CoA dehydratase [Candidatus Lokiarchaeota archaeon]
MENTITIDKKCIGWLCSYTPIELIYAAGFLPYRIIGHSNPPQNSDSYIHPNFCQFIKSTVDVAIEGGYGFLEGVIFVNSCDAMRRLHDVWKRYVSTKFIHILDIPMGNLSLGSKYLEIEFLKLKSALEKHISSPIKEEDIKNAICIYNISRLLYNQLNSLRMEDPPLITAGSLMKITSDFFKVEPEVWNEKIKQLIEEKKSDTPKVEQNKNPRILLSGSPLHEIEFIKFIEEIGLNVVYEDLCTGSKFFDLNVKDSNNLISSLSEAYLTRTPCARMMQIKERADQIIKNSEKFNVDGVIHHSLKFCDTYLYDVPALKKILVENGLSVLFIESDGGLGDVNQIRTRIEAFSEMIKN